MTEHLPECPTMDKGERGICICYRLRACEQRVLLSKPNIELSAVYGYEAGRSDGLSAARDAVAALPQHWPNSPALHRGTALAAIDALRGEHG